MRTNTKKAMSQVVIWIVLSCLFLIVIIVMMSKGQGSSNALVDIIRGLGMIH